MNRNVRKIMGYIKRARNKNVSDDKIKEILSSIGWPSDYINKVFERIEKKHRKIRFPFRAAKNDESNESPVKINNPKENPEEPEEPEEPKEDVTVIAKEPKKMGLVGEISSLKEKMDLIIEKGGVKKGKKFKLPFKVKGQLKALAKKGKVMVILLKTNRSIEMTSKKIENGFIQVAEKYYNCATAFVYLLFGKFPCIVLPEWDLNPIGTKDYLDAVKDGRKADAQDMIIRAMENKENMQRGKMGGKTLIFVIVGAVILAYVIFGQG